MVDYQLFVRIFGEFPSIQARKKEYISPISLYIIITDFSLISGNVHLVFMSLVAKGAKVVNFCVERPVLHNDDETKI